MNDSKETAREISPLVESTTSKLGALTLEESALCTCSSWILLLCRSLDRVRYRPLGE